MCRTRFGSFPYFEILTENFFCQIFFVKYYPITLFFFEVVFRRVFDVLLVSNPVLFAPMSIDPRIFRAYDIRGRAHDQLDEAACRAIGQAFGTVLRRKYSIDHPRVVVGRDARTHSASFEDAAVEGLLAAGCHVLRMHLTPSPVNYFTICTQKLDGGLQITASHNPGHDNGIKLQVRDAEAYSGDDLQALRKMIEGNDVLTGTGSTEEFEALTPYIDHLAAMFAGAGKGKRIAVDGGNGIAGPTNCRALTAVGATITELFIEPDGTFPNHAADPSKHATLVDLQKAVRTEKLDVGFAFDGDGDRLGIVDDTGIIRSADEILLLLARDHLQRNPGGTVVFTVSNSSMLETEISRWGGKPVMCKVGHSYVEHAMREHHALLGGEQSGHYFCGEGYFSFDDALVAALHVLRIMHAAGKPLSELFAEFPKTFQAHEMRPHVDDDKKADVIRRVTEHFSATYPVNTLDGARIDFGDGAWAGIRQSNTSPCISVCIEARSAAHLKTVEKTVLDHLHSYPEITWESAH